MKKLVIVAALMLALAMALGACGETHKATYAWIFLDGKTVVKEIYVKGRIVNIVVK